MDLFTSQSNNSSLLSPELDKAEYSNQLGDPVPLEWMGRATSFPTHISVVDFIREIARARPDAPAIQDDTRVISFGELDHKSDLVAGELLKRGLQIDESVAVMTPLSWEYLAGILGILKAGGCYFPIDTETPAKRLEFLLADCRARFMWANSASQKRLKNWQGTIMDLAQVVDKAANDSGKVSLVPSDPHRTAYLLYTSGSTGQPKGVQIEHHSLTNFVCSYHRYFNLTSRDRSSMLAYIAFDVSVSDIWPALCAGGTVVVPPRGILHDPDGLIHWLEAQEITLSFIPTGLAEILLTRSWPKQMKLRYLVTGGDRLRVRPPAELPFTVINGYGPTESTVFSTISVVKPEDGSGKPPPIGCPLDNVTTYVLDEKLQPLPIGAIGELYLGGAQLARGYLGRPELTQKQFIPDPFSGISGTRMYRTGDWARWLPDGELDFIGRKDDQIQIRGYRVELGEIESLLFAHKAVKQVCCVPHLVGGMPTSIVAHIVPNDRSPDPSQELRDYLNNELPEYMVPSQFVLHERLPLTPQGKADRAAMTAFVIEHKEPSSLTPAEDGLEKALAGLWHSLLPEAAGSSSNTTFAELGGDSLLLVKLMLSVREITGHQLDASAFLPQPTLNGLCKAVKAQMAQAEFQPVLALRKHGNRPPLFFLYGLSGDIEMYFDLADALGDDQPIYGIRSPALQETARLPSSIEAAAAEILGHIRKTQPHGVPALVGYCWAGQVAFEVSRQLARTHAVHCFTAAIGSDAPLRPMSFASRLIHFIKCFLPWLWDLISNPINRQRRILRLFGVTVKQNQSPTPTEAVTGWDSSLITRHLLDLAKKYRPLPKSDVPVTVFRERNDFNPRGHPARPEDTCYLLNGGWDFWTSGDVGIHWLNGDHILILKPPLVASLAQAIRLAHDQYLQK